MGISAVATLSFLALWAAVLFDVHRTDHRFVRQGPKWCWMIFVVTLPIIGAVGWMLFGRPFFAVRREPVFSSAVVLDPAVAPEDTPEWAEFVKFHAITNDVRSTD